MANILGIDYGRKNIGLAYSIGSLAEPIAFIENDHNTIKHLKETCEHHKVKSIVIGISEGDMAEETRAFANKVKDELKFPVTLQDETLSSYETGLKLFHTKRKKRSQPQDAFQAATILQDYLDSFITRHSSQN